MVVFKDLRLSVDARFVLQALICRESSSLLSISFKVKAVAKQLCLTERLVREGMQELADVGLLVSRRRADKVGRPVQEYESSQSLCDLVALVGQGEAVHQDLIVRLFSEPEIYALGPFSAGVVGTCEEKGKPARKPTRKDGRPAAPGAKGRLAASTRVLLAALLSFADQCGVATGVSETRLRAMTGLNALSLKHQVKRLISLGFIRTHVPGVSSGIFVGAKVPTIYYLNLDHPQLRTARGECGLVVHVALGPEKFDRLATGIPSAQTLKALGPAALEMLYHKLAGHTSRLLSAVWAEPDEIQREVTAVVAANIANELGDLWVGSPAKDKGYYWTGMQDNFHAAACEWADSLHKRLLRWNVWRGYRPQLVRLIPAPNRTDGLTISSLVVYPAPQSAVTCLVVWDKYDGRVDHYGREEELDLALRCDAGLLTKD
ncbi:hypothetical protein [Stutzerimonas azotifigens]|uniref:hypothetical protein n=1 Tax=Stutzerimonas azotifigens TaxID=291995 RepID=UPI000A017823|nr:hypothetical protein [Stutzerimonas azotifigens]